MSLQSWALPPCPSGENVYRDNCFGTWSHEDGTKYIGEWKNNKILIDSAHNPLGAEVLAREREAWPNQDQGVYWILGVQKKKDFFSITQKLLKPQDRILLVPVPNHESWTLELISKNICLDERNINEFENLDLALQYLPENVTVLNNYAYYLSLRGQHLEKAKKMSKKTIELFPEEANYLDTFLNYDNFFVNINYEFTPELFLLVLLVSSVSQIGDLTISYFKRISKIKNTGKLIPGHGGLLDRVDGLIFAVPFSYILFKLFY